jgi:hypothetical protein
VVSAVPLLQLLMLLLLLMLMPSMALGRGPVATRGQGLALGQAPPPAQPCLVSSVHWQRPVLRTPGLARMRRD